MELKKAPGIIQGSDGNFNPMDADNLCALADLVLRDLQVELDGFLNPLHERIKALCLGMTTR